MSIRVATFNAWALPGPLAAHRDARVRAIGEQFPALDADVIALQEIWADAPRRFLVEALERAGYRHHWHHERTMGGSGLLLASRFPISDVHFEPFAARGFAERIAHMDYYAGKGFVRATVESQAGPLVAVATHLHANYAEPGDADEYVGIRAAQLIQLAAGLSDIDLPVIAVGDFNITEHEEGYRLLRGLTGLRDVAAALEARAATSRRDNPYHQPEHVDARIDYVFHRPGTGMALAPRSIGRILDARLDFGGEAGSYSDHSGLLAEFDFADSDPPRASDPAAREEALRLGAQLVDKGRAISELRRTGQRTAAGGALLATAAAAAGARTAGLSRRRFLRGGLGLAAGLATFGVIEQAWQSEWMHEYEVSGFDVAEQQLGELRHTTARSG
ncbi:MAG: hypothetical protein GY944_26800 [bacterium]|nr:hypothetical protein [bacterium]